MALKAVGSNPIIHPIKKQRNRKAIPLFLYGVNTVLTIRTHYELLRNSFSVRVVLISNYTSTYAHAWVQNPIIDARYARVIFALRASDIASQ